MSAPEQPAPSTPADESADESPDTRCPACGATFPCGVERGEPDCWCFARPRVTPDPRYARCVCPACLGRPPGETDE